MSSYSFTPLGNGLAQWELFSQKCLLSFHWRQFLVGYYLIQGREGGGFFMPYRRIHLFEGVSLKWTEPFLVTHISDYVYLFMVS